MVLKTNEYKITHIKTERYYCNQKYNLAKKGNYESLISFKKLPPFSKLKKNGRKWKYTKTYQPIMDRLILDVDCDENLQQAYEVTQLIMQDLNEYTNSINVYFSGSKGFHIEILTDELNIIDIKAESAKESCIKYAEFLNYFNDKYNEVDTSLKDVGSRIIRVHHSKHEKTGNYKILIDINASLEDILTNSKENKDMTEPAETYLSQDTAFKLLSTYNKPIDDTKKELSIDDFGFKAETDENIYTDVFNDLNTNIHDKILLIGAGLNGYVTKSELESIYVHLDKTTNISDSNNAKKSFINAYEQDRKPCSLGALYNHYDKHDIDKTNFFILSDYLNSKVEKNSYDEFIELMELYEYDWFKLFEDKLYDFKNNSENVFFGVIHSLSALIGVGHEYSSRIIILNGGSGVGKSKYIKTLVLLNPKGVFINLGSSTPASIRRSEEQTFNKKIVDLGDKGLKGDDDEEFKGLMEVFANLVTEGVYIRDVVDGKDINKCRLESEGTLVFMSAPFTNLRKHGAGDQYITRSSTVTINPLEYEEGFEIFDGIDINEIYKSDNNPFHNLHRNYMQYILKNPLRIEINRNIKRKLYDASNGGVRTAKYMLGLFNAYCQYLRINDPDNEDAEAFLEVFKQNTVTPIERMIYEKLYKNLFVLTPDEAEYKITSDGEISNHDYLLTQNKNRKERCFFTAKQIKTYFKNDFKRNKNLKDTIDKIPEILNNLYNASLIERIEWQYNNQNVYYIPYNQNMEN